MIALHFVTERYPPTPGGLERRTMNLAHCFAKLEFRVFVHVLSPFHDAQYYGEHDDGVMLYTPCYENLIVEEPIATSKTTDFILSAENYRVKFLCLRNSVKKVQQQLPSIKHVLISNFITRIGFVSSQVAEELSIGHIACIVGSDFSRGFRNPIERTTIERVLAQANAVITLNKEFELNVRRIFPLTKVFTIHNSVHVGEQRYALKPKSETPIKIFCDCGYSYKKGTQLLLSALRQLVVEGFDVHLTICGEIALEQQNYWMEQIEKYTNEIPQNFLSVGFLSQDKVRELMVASHLYCSPTLGEGCSNSRIAALCLGVPMVTTLCGEIADIAVNVPHIRLCMPGDYQGFLNTLREMMKDFTTDSITIDEEKVTWWNMHFNSSREIRGWFNVLREIGAIPTSIENTLYCK